MLGVKNVKLFLWFKKTMAMGDYLSIRKTVPLEEQEPVKKGISFFIEISQKKKRSLQKM